MSLVLPPVEVGPVRWDWSRTYVFGIVNVTPDSFSDGGKYLAADAAVEQALRLVADGADAVDVGGESTRPGATPVTAEEEIHRVLPVIEALASQLSVPISIDTTKAKVARAAVRAGASIVNDISGGRLDREMYAAMADTGAVVVLGHLRGQPRTMQQQVAFDDVVADVVDELRQVARRAIGAGVGPQRLWLDPGIGFGKTAEHSLALVRETARLVAGTGYPLMVGPSRKSFIGAVTGAPVGERLIGTCAATTAAILGGAAAVRLHDVGPLRQGVLLADAIRRGGPC